MSGFDQFDLGISFRPIDQWPGELERGRRRSPFSAGWTQTRAQLHRELRELSAKNVVLQIAITEADLRIDGTPRARAVASHPGVILAFDSRFGPLKYATDRFDSWQDNVRAIALGLEALRRVDRYGITKRGEQYTGWKAIGTGSSSLSRVEALRAIAELAYEPETVPVALERMGDRDGPEVLRTAIRRAAKRAHPDAGGTPEQWATYTRARAVLEPEGTAV